jgi:hypothetical protein
VFTDISFLRVLRSLSEMSDQVETTTNEVVAAHAQNRSASFDVICNYLRACEVWEVAPYLYVQISRVRDFEAYQIDRTIEHVWRIFGFELMSTVATNGVFYLFGLHAIGFSGSGAARRLFHLESTHEALSTTISSHLAQDSLLFSQYP